MSEPYTFPRFNRNLFAVAHDSAMAALSFLIAVYLRLGLEQMYLSDDYLIPGALLFTLICAPVFYFMRLYRGMWRYSSMRDMAAILKAVTLAILIFVLMMFLVKRLDGMPRSVLFINWMLLLFLLAGPRFAVRALSDRTLSLRRPSTPAVKIPVLLIGANNHAERFIRDMSRDPRALFEAVAIVDDNPKRKGSTIHGIPIYDGGDMLPAIVAKLERQGKRPQKLILTDDNAAGVAVRHLLEVADTLGIPLARLPKPSEVKSHMHDQLDVQPIAVEDLLGRSQNVQNRDPMRALVAGKKVLITGAGGTIGGELTRQIAAYSPSQLILLENSEFNCYQIDREIRGRHADLPLISLLADVRDTSHIDHIMERYTPQLVFHAAAIKHVPIAEDNAEEAILTNVQGTRNLAESCLRHKAEVMVMISTDKAINPTSVMGAAKRLAESICQALGHDGGATRYITVRFGNVLGSAGSVVPLFQEQLAKGGPITVTDPAMTRYFMTVREAVELVLQAATLGVAMRDRRESIFVLDMGEPVRIVDLAEQMIRLAGLKPHEDIKITYTGLRPGEKLYEELFHLSENAIKTSHEGIFLASPRFCDMASLRPGLNRLMAACAARKAQEARSLLKELVPEFEPAHNR